MKYWLITFLLIAHLVVTAQEEGVVEQQLESITELLGEEIDDSYLQHLHYLQEYPISVNHSTVEDWQQLRWLTDLQIESLMRYRKAMGPLISIYELQAVPLWDISTIKKVLPFVSMDDPIDLKNTLLTRFTAGQHSLLLRTSRVVEKQKGYNKELANHYAGTEDRLLVRYRYQFKNLLQYGITAEKDPGEAFFNGAQSNGFDFYSFHLFLRNLGKVKTLAIGDFTVNMGQGLVQWQALAFKKNAEALQVKRQGSVLQPYSAATEYNFNRGVGITWQKDRLEITAFGSQRNIDGSSKIDTIAEEEVVTSFYNAGYHRTASEIAKRGSVNYRSIGGVLGYKHDVYHIKANVVLQDLSHALQVSDKPYDLYGIKGKTWYNYSVDYGYTYRNFHAFGEIAMDKNHQRALLNGLIISIDPKVDLSMLYRNIQPNYQALWGNAFTESIQPTNEKGIYTGITVRPSYYCRIDLYADMYQFPWLKYRVDAPSKGQDYLLQASYQPNKQVEINIKLKSENKERNASVDSISHFLETLPKESLRMNMVYKLRRDFTLKGRTEMVWFKRARAGSEEGFLMYLQGDYILNSQWKANLRFQYFETDSYESRVYAYENDVLYGYSIPAFFDRGIRYYFNISHKVNKSLTIWGRWAQTLYKNKNQIGSGLDAIEGFRRSDYKIQIRYNL